MGNSNKTSVYVKLDSTAYRSGDCLQGEICVKIRQNIKCESLILQLLGIESTMWEEFSKRGVAHVISRKGRHVILQKELILHTWKDKCGKKGHYSFPFTIVLPPYIPGSLNYAINMVEALVKYELTAILVTEPEPIIVREEIKLIQAQTENYEHSSTGTISTFIKCCCLPQGNIFMRASFDKQSYVVGEVMNIVVDIDSRIRRINARTVTAILYRTLRLRSENGNSKIIRERIKQRSVLAPRKGSLLAGEVMKILVSLNLDSELIDKFTTRGVFVNCSYSVVVTAYLDMSWAWPEPEIEIWADIVPQVKKTKHPAVQRWDPLIMPTVMIEPSAPPLEY